ncbi:MAG: type I methionyl aminopeptidase [Candidatus Liptonbacteria bacterium]|nr:type I methionyl aminopeptidase [Candidatus Liptonbacteria bacterium]
MSYVKTPKEVEALADAGKRLASVLAALCEMVQPGLATCELDVRARALIKEAGGVPAFLGYAAPGSAKRYPAALCVSVNDVIVHGLPSSYVVREGDVVKLDVGLKLGGWYADAARTVLVGNVSLEARRLSVVTEEALAAGIAAAKPRNTVGDIGAAIATRVRHAGFSIADQLTGHGIGRELHEAPAVLNVGAPGRGQELMPGMVLAIEPMVAAGSGQVEEREDGSFATKDGSLTAHFEHTVAIAHDGPKVLTLHS